MPTHRAFQGFASVALAALIATLPHNVGAQDRAAEPRPELTAVTSEFDVATGDFVATGNARITYDDIVLTADEVRLNQRTFQATAKGNVVISGRGLRLVGTQGVFNLRDRRVEIGDFRAGTPPWFASAEKAEGTLDNLLLTRPVVYMGEPAGSSPLLRADSGTIIGQSQVALDNPVVALGTAPGLPLPDLTRSLVDTGLRLRARIGYKKDLGAFIRPVVTARITEGLDFVGGVDGFSQRGAMVAPGARYEGRGGSSTYTGTVRSGWIWDRGGRERLGTDVLGRQIDDQRGFAEWRHLQTWTNGNYLAGNFSWWSDSEVTRDFRSETYRETPQPDSWVEFGAPTGGHGLFSAFVRPRADEFQPVVQKLPELRYDLFPNRLTQLGIVQKGFASLSYRRLTVPEEELLGLFPDSFTVESARGDFHYGLERTLNLAPWANLTPLAGVRWTGDAPVGPDADLAPDEDLIERRVATVGADLRFFAFGTFDVAAPGFGIDGLRHLVEPVLSYRRSYDLGGDANLPIDPLDPPPQFLFEDSFELDRQVDPHSRIGEHEFRIGLRQALQTRDRTGVARELATLHIGQDYLPIGSGALQDSPWRSLFAELRLKPASFLEAGWTTRYNHTATSESGPASFAMSNPSLTLRDGRRWRLTLANHYLAGLYNDYSVSGWFAFTEAWAAGFRLAYDERGERFREQTYLVEQTLDNLWRIEYRLSRTEGDRRDESFSLGIAVDLLSF